MKASPCFYSPAATIRSVFLNNATPLVGQAHLQRLLVPSTTAPSQRSFSGRTGPTTNRFQLGTFRPPSSNFDRREPKPTDGKILNHNIKGQMVVIRTKEGTLSEPQDKLEVLRSLDLDRSALEMLAEPKPGRPFPICRIILHEDEQKKAYAEMKMHKKKLQNEIKVAQKEIEINWAMAPHDLVTKIRRLKGFLEKGYRVDVTLMHPKKKSKRKASDEEAKQVFAEVMKVLEEVPGTQEYKSRQGNVGKLQLLFLQGQIPKKSAESPLQEEENSEPDGAVEEKEAVPSPDRLETTGG